MGGWWVEGGGMGWGAAERWEGERGGGSVVHLLASAGHCIPIQIKERPESVELNPLQLFQAQAARAEEGVVFLENERASVGT